MASSEAWPADRIGQSISEEFSMKHYAGLSPWASRAFANCQSNSKVRLKPRAVKDSARSPRVSKGAHINTLQSIVNTRPHETHAPPIIDCHRRSAGRLSITLAGPNQSRGVDSAYCAGAGWHLHTEQ